MWPRTFDARLASWYQLRQQAADLPLEYALVAINQWWFTTPWIPYHLHWDDQDKWPDPWQLLEDNLYCNLARGLGILYTIAMIDRADLQNAVLLESQSDNLVLIPKKKYILNWDRDQIVNINLPVTNRGHRLEQAQLKQQIK